MEKNGDLLYREAFHSTLRDIAPWLQWIAGIIMVFIVGSLILIGPPATNLPLKPLFFAGATFFFVGVYVKTTRATGEVAVSSSGLCIEQEMQKELFSKQDLLYTAPGECIFGREGGVFVRFQDESGQKQFQPCFIRPCHHALFGVHKGVVLITPKSKRAIFVPTKNPEELLKALKKMGE
ncbi:hypothetical protein KBB27_03440 [Patescibacteria group bacterium]|nr:hypothetical protein [Patescibacteria group bacterium]